MIAGGILLTSQDAITKWLTSDYHAGEIMAYRGIVMLLLVAGALSWPRQGGGNRWPELRARQPGAVAVRSVFAFATSTTVVLSFAFLPLAEALAVIFISPLLLTALSVPLLKEPVGWRRWSAVAVGFAGMLLIVRPGGDAFGWFVVFPLAAAALGAGRDGITRLIGTRETTLCLTFYMVLAAVIGGVISLAFGTHWPSWRDWGLFAAAGLLGVGAYYFTTRAFQIAQAAAMSPFKYLSLVWGAILGYLVWGDVPDTLKIAGAAVVVASGLYILHRETLAHRRET